MPVKGLFGERESGHQASWEAKRLLQGPGSSDPTPGWRVRHQPWRGHSAGLGLNLGVLAEGGGTPT